MIIKVHPCFGLYDEDYTKLINKRTFPCTERAFDNWLLKKTCDCCDDYQTWKSNHPLKHAKLVEECNNNFLWWPEYKEFKIKSKVYKYTIRSKDCIQLLEGDKYTCNSCLKLKSLTSIRSMKYRYNHNNGIPKDISKINLDYLTKDCLKEKVKSIHQDIKVMEKHID